MNTFDLSGFDLNTVNLGGIWRVADIAKGIYINNNLVSGTVFNGFTFGTDQSFSLLSGSGFFVDGLNTIEIRGQSVNNVWDAFWLSGAIEGDIQTVPEPSILALFVIGLGGLAFIRRRKAQS